MWSPGRIELSGQLGQLEMSSMKELQDAESWQYRGEGAANIVLAYGGDDPELTGKVLRLRKSLKNDKSASNAVSSGAPVLSLEEQKVWADWPALVSATTISELNHAYARDVLRPSLGDNHVDPGTLVYIGSSFIEDLDRQIGHERPAWRAESGSLETLPGIGLLISDHTHFPTPAGNAQESPPRTTISVELKPKCGFLPTTPMIKDERSIKRRLSRFTMHQQLKLNQGKLQQVSKYNPLDLFSGTRYGILKAIGALFDTPQINLRVFLNGDEIFGASQSDKPSLARLDDVLEGFVSARAGGRVQAFQQLVADLLLESDILRKLLELQKLDYRDIEGAIQAYHTFLRYHDSLPESSGTDEGYENQSIASSAASVDNCRMILRDFLISATAKDCGLMLSLQRLGERDVVRRVQIHNANVFSSLDGDFLQKILLLDLDIKRLKKMNYYLKLDQEIVQAYKSSAAS